MEKLLHRHYLIWIFIFWTLVATGDAFKFVCTFESKNFCNMVQDDADDFDWTLHQGQTPSGDTGPDEAASGKYYIFIESSDPRKPGDTARLLLPKVPSTGKYQLSFKYSMYGFHTGKLIVYHKSNDQDKEIFLEKGDKGKGWKEAKIDLVIKTGEQVVFEGVRGTGYSGDIALDDILLVSLQSLKSKAMKPMFKKLRPMFKKKPKTTSTAQTTTEATTTTTIATVVVPSVPIATAPGTDTSDNDVEKTTIPPPAFICNFDDYCSMTRDLESPVQWRISKPSTNLASNGRFLALLVSKKKQDVENVARITIKYGALQEMQRYCLEFRYFLYSGKDSRIDIEVSFGASGTGPRQVFRSLQQRSKKWQHCRQRIFKRRNFYFTIIGTLGTASRGIVAIDDLRVVNC